MKHSPRLLVAFFRTSSGREPVREWLKALPIEERRVIGEEIKAVQFGWPIGMPLLRKLGSDFWEIRVRLSGRVARVFVTIEGNTLVLLHGFIKKDQKIPQHELELARTRLLELKWSNKQ